MALALILDMDGLLLDTEPISLRVWKEAATSLGYELDPETCDRMIGLNQQTNRQMLLERFGPKLPVDELVASAQARYREALEEHVPHKEGLLGFVDFLKARRLPRAVATSTATDLARRKLQHAGVLEHFDIVVGGDRVERGKPYPDIFLMAAAELGHRPADCVVLEDSGPGIRAAAAAGMRSILIPDGREPTDEIRQAAHIVVPSLAAAQLVIDRMLTGRSGS